jgi:threonine/homoserine/homoserine lactone efflux protein
VIAPGTLAVFFVASALLALAPGPDNLYVLAQSALRGPGAGLSITVGLCTGLLVHTAAVTLGVAALMRASPAAFAALKLAGAGYLLYLAWRAFGAAATELQAARERALGGWAYYRRGIFMNVTNPKVSIFFLAFLPQFADPAHGALAPQLMLLGGVFIVAALLVFGAISFAAGALGERLRRSARAQRVLNRIAGAVFVGLALKLAASEIG